MNKTISIFSFCLVLSGFAYAQDLPSKFKQFNVEDGLSQSWVQCILQDTLGFMWFGTDDGLNRFDGYTFKVYKHNNTTNKNLRSNSIRCITEDLKGRIWIGTLSGLHLFERGSESFLAKDGWPTLQINDIVRCKNKLFVGTILGLYVLDTENDSASLLNVKNQKMLFNSIINALVVDKQNNIWIGTTNGLFVLNKEQNKLYNVSTDFRNIKYHPEKNISSLEVDKYNRIWVGLAGGGLDLISYTSDITLADCMGFSHSDLNPFSISKGNVRALKADRKGFLWIGVENSGLDIININHQPLSPIQFNHIKSDPEEGSSISSNSIYKFYEDLRGDIWIGTYGGGINFYNSKGENFITFKHLPNNSNSLPNSNVNVFYELNKKIWIGTEGGLSQYSPEENSFINFTNNPGNKNSLSSNAVWSIEEFNSKLWIGTWSGGISIFDPVSFRFTRIDTSKISGNNIFTLNADSKGLLWIATMGAV